MYFKGKMTQVALYDGSLSLRDKTKPLTIENVNEFSADIKIINARDEVILYQYENVLLLDLAKTLSLFIDKLTEYKSEGKYIFNKYYNPLNYDCGNPNPDFEWLIEYKRLFKFGYDRESIEQLTIYVSSIGYGNAKLKTGRIDLTLDEVSEFCDFIYNFANESLTTRPIKKYSTKGKVNWVTLKDFSNYLGEVYLEQVDGEEVIMFEGYKHIFDDNERHYFESLQKVSFKESEIQYIHEADSKNELNYYKMRSKLVKLK